MGLLEWIEKSKEIKKEFAQGDKFAKAELSDIEERAKKPREN